MRYAHVVGARPNFMKVAPVMTALTQHGVGKQMLIHTGQHYDANMSSVFFEELGLPQPDLNLGVGSDSHARQTAKLMIHLEEAIISLDPELVMVYGDINSTMAATLVCAKMQIPVAHVEAGLRSFDRTMPEEINRLVTDQISDLLFTPSADANENLLREGVNSEKIHLVGNVMIDTLVRLLPEAAQRWPDVQREHGLDTPFGLVTLHRPSNVDDPATLGRIINTLDLVSQQIPIVFPTHPRTVKRIQDLGLWPKSDRLRLISPLSYLSFLAATLHAAVVITDSGGIQEETTYLGVPCITVRENTERPITATLGTNVLVGHDMQRLQFEVNDILNGRGKQGEIPPLWDGRAGERIAQVITSL